jgi:hypothetical protein
MEDYNIEYQPWLEQVKLKISECFTDMDAVMREGGPENEQPFFDLFDLMEQEIPGVSDATKIRALVSLSMISGFDFFESQEVTHRG